MSDSYISEWELSDLSVSESQKTMMITREMSGSKLLFKITGVV